MNHFSSLLFLIILHFSLPVISKKKLFGNFIQHHQQNKDQESDWKTVYESTEATTQWGVKYEWDVSGKDFVCGANFHFDIKNEIVKKIFEHKMVPNDLNFYMCNFDDWNKQWSYANLDLNEPSALMCPENNFIIGFQWYWTPENVLQDDDVTDVFRLKIICSPSLSFVGFDVLEKKDPIMFFRNEFICGYQVGTTNDKTFANALKVKLCKRPEIKVFWNLIEEGLYGRWLTPLDWSNRYLNQYGCGINLYLLKPQNEGFIGPNDDAPIQGIDLIACNLYNWNNQKIINLKNYDSIIDENRLNQNSYKCLEQEFIIGLQVRYDFTALGEDALGITGINIKCGKIWDFEEKNWANLDTGTNKGIWREKKNFIGGICGILLKWNKDQGQGDLKEEDNTGLNGMKIKICPKLFKQEEWKKVFDLNEAVDKKISWEKEYKDYFGCGVAVYTKRLKSPFIFLNPDLLMNISIIACKLNNWNEQITRETIENTNYNEYKTMCPPNEFIYGIQRYMRKSKVVHLDNEMKEDFFRLKIICGPSMNSFDVYSGNPQLFSMFFIEKSYDKTIFFKNALIVGYSYGFMSLEFSLKMYKQKIKNVMGSLSFMVRPIITDKKFFSKFSKKSWKSLTKVESNGGNWETIIDWSLFEDKYVAHYFFHFQENLFLVGMSFSRIDTNYDFQTTEIVIGQSFGNYNYYSCEHNKFISGLQFKRAWIENLNVFIGYKVLCEFFDGDGTSSDWSHGFEANIKGGVWEDKQFLIYGGKKAFLCGIVPKTQEISFNNKNYKVIVDLDLSMCSYDYEYKAKNKIIRLEGKSEGEWMKLTDSRAHYYACGIKIGVGTSSSIEGMEFKFCDINSNKDKDSFDYIWLQLDSKYTGSWKEPINCPDKKLIGGLQLQFRNLDSNSEVHSVESKEDIINQKKGELVGFRILCRGEKDKKYESFNHETWIHGEVDSKGIWGERNYMEKNILICAVGDKMFEGKLNGLQLQTCLDSI